MLSISPILFNKTYSSSLKKKESAPAFQEPKNFSTPSSSLLRAYSGISFKGALEDKVKTPIIRELLAKNCEDFGLSNTFLIDIDQKLLKTDDKKIKDYVLNKLKQDSKEIDEDMSAFFPTDTDELNHLLDAVTCSKGDSVYIGDLSFDPDFKSGVNKYYSRLKRDFPDETEFLLKNTGKKFEIEKAPDYYEINENSVKDFDNEQKFERLKTYINMNIYGNAELKKHLYNDYYLKNAEIPESVKKKCKKINEEYNTKVFLSENTDDYKEVDFIADEFADFKKVSNGKALLPLIIDMSQTDINYIDYDCTDANTNGFADRTTRQIKFNSQKLYTSLRHELIHLNDRSDNHNIGIYEPSLIPEYSVTDFTKSADILRGGQLKKVIDLARTKYADELIKAGVSLGHTVYGYSSDKEFLAVAGSADTSVYSQEFKEVLVDMGLPKWVFDLKKPA